MQSRSAGAASSLELLTKPFGLPTLRALVDDPLTLEAVRARLGSPPATTLRGQMRTLTDSRAVEKRRNGGFPGGFDYRLTSAGAELLEVAESLSDWLGIGSTKDVQLGGPDARRATRALVDAWQSGIVDALVASPRTLAEVSSLIPDLSYPTLERRLSTLRGIGFVEPVSEGQPGHLGPTVRLRLAVGPITQARRWETQWGWPAPPLSVGELNTALLLAAPLAHLPTSLSGTLLLSMEKDDGVEVSIEKGSASARPRTSDATRDACGSASPEAWAAAIFEGDAGEIRLSGRVSLATTLLAAVHNALRTK